MKNTSTAIDAYLFARKQQHLYRAVKISESAQAPEMIIDGKPYLTFCSNDYLGLANNPNIINAFKQAADTYGVGSGAAHLINGHTREHHALEEELAVFTGRERTLLFSNGYMANLGVISALLGRNDYLFQDRLNHASLIDAGLLSKSKVKRYSHNDINHLQKLLMKLPAGASENTQMIVTDGVFSMDGDQAPMKALAQIAHQQKAWLMVDDAHGFGVLGNNGAGILEQSQLNQNDVPILMATLGKAAGSSGAFVAGSEALIEFLMQTTRTFIYTTAMPASIAAASRASLTLIQKETWRRDTLNMLIQRFKQGANELGIALMASDTAIQPILVGRAERALELSQSLQQKGLLITAIRPPTVPEGSARLRVTLSAKHSEEHIDRLLDALSKSLD